jgi:hypothetical protein
VAVDNKPGAALQFGFYNASLNRVIVESDWPQACTPATLLNKLHRPREGSCSLILLYVREALQIRVVWR